MRDVERAGPAEHGSRMCRTSLLMSLPPLTSSGWPCMRIGTVERPSLRGKAL